MLTIRRLLLATLLAAGPTSGAAPARAYPVDCAIFLCLAGGWPASPVCARAKATFLRRLTPFPVEPPLQIWRCPMGGGRATSAPPSPAPVVKAPATTDRSIGSTAGEANYPGSTEAFERKGSTTDPDDAHRAELDLPDPVLDVIRSIRVHHIRYAQRTTSGGGAGEACERRDGSRLATYGLDGGFRWEEATAGLVPSGPGFSAFDPPANCRWYHYRSVAVSWTDALGHKGFEEVRY